MIVRTHSRAHVLDYCLGLQLGVGLLLGLFILTVGLQEAQCHCKGVNCLTRPYFLAENILNSAKAPRPHTLHARQVETEVDLQKPSSNVKPNEPSANASSGAKLYMEGGANDNPKPISDTKTSDKHATLLPQPTIDSKPQVPNISNTSIGKLPTEDFDKSLYNLNTAALLRGFYVFGGLGAMVVMYILVRTIRLRRKKTTVRRYGVLTNREDVEMTPLGADDDEDTTIFEMTPNTRT